MKRKERLVRFDWAIKRLLRHRAEHSVLNGFLTSLFGRKIEITEILESESNRDYEENKSNRVDILARDSDGSKIIIEVQNETEGSYLHRMLFGTSRLISEFLEKGHNYDEIRKNLQCQHRVFQHRRGGGFRIPRHHELQGSAHGRAAEAAGVYQGEI